MNQLMPLDKISYLEKLYPYEGCGFMLKDQWLPVENKINEVGKAENDDIDLTEMSFAIPLGSFLKHSRNISAIVHSHCYDQAHEYRDHPSVADQKHQIATAVPWEIVVVRNGFFLESYTFDLRTPKSGDNYRLGVSDELTLIEEYHGKHLGIFRDEKSITDDWLTWLSHELVLRNLFSVVEEKTMVKPGDILFSGKTNKSGTNYLSVMQKDFTYANYNSGELACTSNIPGSNLYLHLRKN